METTPQTNVNRIKTADLLRTKGALTGNFGKARVKAGSTLNELGASEREHIGNLPTQDEYLRRLSEALGKATDPKVRAFIEAELRKAKLQRITTHARVCNPQGPHCDLSQRRVAASR